MCTKEKLDRKTRLVFSLMLLVAAMLLSCSERVETEVQKPVVNEEPEPINLLLACAPSSSVNAMTRLAENVVQSGDSYRSISNFRFIPLKDNVISNSQIDEPSEFINKTAVRYYHSAYCSMERGVNGCLVYAKAVDYDKGTPEATSIYNGSLNAVMSNSVSSTSDIHFEPVPIYEDVSTVPAEATALGNALTKIVNDVPMWPASKNPVLENLYSNFTNRKLDIPGSAASVKQWMQSLSDAADAYLTNPPSSLGDDEKEILNNIKIMAAKAAEDITIDATSYPRNINLPDGAAVLRWTEVEENSMKVNKFVPQLETTTLDNINSVSRFVYPPSLYYFVDSELKTSNTKIDYDGDDGYKDDASWSEVLARFTDGGTIQSSTKTVAVAEPLQYAVAQLQVKVKANAVNLKYAEDAEEHDITIPINAENEGVTTNFFRLTGVIIDGQRPVDYQFQQASNLDSDVKFVFDSQVPENFYLTTTAFDDNNAKVFNSLVLQSFNGEDVKIILEFEYTGPQEFKCLNGYVYPGTRFYLVGKVDLFQAVPPVELTDEEKTELKKRVFTQDHTTMVQMTVTSLEKAYNVLPSILSKNLEIGVETTPKWIFATPPDPVILDDED